MKLGVKLVALAGLSAGILLTISCHSTRLDQQEQVNIEDPVSVSNFLFNGRGVVISSYYSPRTLDQKVKEADLIIVGNATAFGEERDISKLNLTDLERKLLGAPLIGEKPNPTTNDVIMLYERNLRININEVLWPPSASQTNTIIFPYYILKSWPESWWNYSNTPGVFFLIRNKQPERSEWTKLDRYTDWMEPETNAALVLASIKKQKR